MLEINYLLNKLEIITPLGQKLVKNLTFFTEKSQISKELNKIEETIEKIYTQEKEIKEIKRNLMYIKDITNTVERLKGEYTLDDIELYEIKYFSLYYEEIRKTMHFSYLKQPSLEKVIEILDPDNNRLPTFYIYDSYSEELANIRKEKKTATDEKKKNYF
ncbi:hypothetical protein [Marinitoga lauensis]|uniref:hypothetical protein n=1 Tax=Marinitoga lauensis TaxID=2201189 RepID=UPI001F0DDD34|nr:hypothetical protein [Marinitoga lauensis]